MPPTNSLTIDEVRRAHRRSRREITSRLAEFEAVWQLNADADRRIWEELVFCIFTANASARMGLRAVAAVKELLPSGSAEDLAAALTGVHRFPNARSRYIVHTREYLQSDCGMRLRERLENFADPVERRDWLAREKNIKGLGYKEASHFLRNVGFRGYAILDKHILNSLAELGVIEAAQAPANRARYLAIEAKMREFAGAAQIDFDELDLVLWSMKTGEILK